MPRRKIDDRTPTPDELRRKNDKKLAEGAKNATKLLMHSYITVICADCGDPSSYATTNELRFRTSKIPMVDSKKKGVITYLSFKLKCPRCQGNNFMKLQEVGPDGEAPFISSYAELTHSHTVSQWLQARREDHQWQRKIEGKRELRSPL